MQRVIFRDVSVDALMLIGAEPALFGRNPGKRIMRHACSAGF
jgi:hypothetical protein